MRFRPNSVFFRVTGGRRCGYTLVEILVALTLTLILMTAVVTVFAGVGEGISKSRRAMEQFDRLRTAAQQIRLDLQGVTVKLDGRPIRPEENQGYFEYIEGGPNAPPPAYNSTSGSGSADSTVGERGDILMFTTRNAARPFQGRYWLSADTTNLSLQSNVAEVAWFLRGKTLHRRVLLVAPGVAQNPSFATQQPSTYYANNDISARLVSGPNGKQLVPNSLADLTKRENRFAHPVSAFPFDARGWKLLGLPTLAECSSPTWMGSWVNGTTPPVNPGPSITQMDYWDNSNIVNAFFGSTSGTASPDQYLAQDGTRLADDVVLTNVIGFDVKVWEPAMNSYVDLGGGAPIALKNFVPPQGPTFPRFNNAGISESQLYGGPTGKYPPYVYDSGCFSYENEGIYHCDPSGKLQVNVAGGKSTNGLDDDGNGIVDDTSERLTSPPYPVPLRGIQITIRCYEPDSRQVRQITIEHDFLPK